MTKPIQIRREDAVRDLRELAELRRKPITDVIAEMARKELDEERRLQDLAGRHRGVEEAVARFQDAMRAHGGRLLTDDDLYDEDGLPK